MLEKFTKEEKAVVGLGPYYLSVSAFQKCVRRGDINRAVNFAKVCWRMEPYRFFSRMWTVIFEDCGRDLPTLLALYKFRSGYSKFEDLVPLICLMCKAQKSRDSAYASFIVRGDQVKPLVLNNALATHPKHNKLLELYKAWPDRGYDSYSVWDFGAGDTNFDWTIELAERAKSFDREGFSAGSPYFFMADNFETCQGFDEVPDIGALWDGWFPMVAADTHTRAGKVSVGTLLKHHPSPFGENSDEMGEGLFILEGWLYRNAIRTDFDFQSLYESMWTTPQGNPVLNFRHPDRMRYYQEQVLPELMNVREWYLSTVAGAEMEMLKRIYADQWIDPERDEKLQSIG